MKAVAGMKVKAIEKTGISGKANYWCGTITEAQKSYFKVYMYEEGKLFDGVPYCRYNETYATYFYQKTLADGKERYVSSQCKGDIDI